MYEVALLVSQKQLNGRAKMHVLSSRSTAKIPVTQLLSTIERFLHGLPSVSPSVLLSRRPSQSLPHLVVLICSELLERIKPCLVPMA